MSADDHYWTLAHHHELSTTYYICYCTAVTKLAIAYHNAFVSFWYKCNIVIVTLHSDLNCMKICIFNLFLKVFSVWGWRGDTVILVPGISWFAS